MWSLVVTIFGDVVMRQGRDRAPGPIWIGPLLVLLEKLGVEAGLARTSLSRLVANGVLDRDKAGRNTFYRLTPGSAEEFARASDKIYARRPPAPATGFRLALTDRAGDRAKARAALEARGFRFFAANSALAPSRERDAGAPPDVIQAMAEPDEPLIELARELWKVEALQAAYADFLARFAAFSDAAFLPEGAILARIVAVHRMRRILLRDPSLPAAALPPDWAGDKAREAFARLLDRVEAPSEAWLAEHRFRSGEATP